MNQELSPPKIPLRLLRWFCKDELLEDVEGDLSELFVARAEDNPSKARRLFTADVLLLFRPGIIKNISIPNRIIQIAMVKNFLIIALRNALRYKGYTVLNLLGLVVGIASSILILLWVNYERSVNSFHANGDKIYQVFRVMHQSNGMASTTSSIPKPAADLVREEYPEVDDVVQVSWELEYPVTLGDKGAAERGYYVTPNFTEQLTFPLLARAGEQLLTDPNTMLVSETLARKHFKEDWQSCLGKTLSIEDIYMDSNYDAKIVGIFKDVPQHSTLRFDFLLPAVQYYSQNSWVDNWGNGSFGAFLIIDSPEKLAAVSDRILSEINDHTQDNNLAGNETLILQKFTDTYLYSNFDDGVVAGGRIDNVRIMTVIAIFLLAIACINFMNLATARSGRRSKEIGLRKVMGARRGSVRVQFFLEAFLLTALSLVLSIGLVLLLLPYFNALVELDLALDFTNAFTWIFLIGLWLIVGFLSGLYPAMLLPTFKIIEAMKGGIKQSKVSTYFRKGLVVFQFAISTLLIIGTAVIYKQMDYMLSKDLGMKKENLVMVAIPGEIRERLLSYKGELLTIPEVSSVSASTGNPLSYGRSTSSANWTGKDPNAGHEINVMLVDEDFIETMGMQMAKGRAFDSQLNDSTNFLINEVAAELMGFDDPLNQDLSFWGIEGKIVGVVKDFHMRNLHEPIAPVIISCYNPAGAHLALVRINGNTPEALSKIEDVTLSFNPDSAFEFQFLDESYAQQYESEQLISLLASIFSVISVFISCLGLFGLASYSAEQRSREIGIRKVHGAQVSQILMLLSRDFSLLLALSFLISIPFGIYVSRNWLDGFEFRIGLDPLLFIIAGVITFGIALLTVMTKSYQAAMVNPVKTLKDE